MDQIYSLVSSLVQTKRIENAIIPILSQVSQLIKLGDNLISTQNNSDALGDKGGAIFLECKRFAKSVQNFAIENIKDEDDRKKLHIYVCSLTEKSEHFLVCSKKLSYHFHDLNNYQQLIKSLKDIVEGILKILIKVDELEIKKISNSIYYLEEQLDTLISRDTQASLTSEFKKFAKSSMEIIASCEKRAKDLRNAHQKQSLVIAITCFKRNIPLFCQGIKKTYKKSGGNHKLQRQISEDFAIGQIKRSLTDIRNAVENKIDCTEDDDDVISDNTQEGALVLKIDKVLEKLAENTNSIDIEINLEGILRHAMTIAYSSNDHYRTSITKISQLILQAKDKFKEILQYDDKNKLQEIKNLIQESLEHLERQVNGAILACVIEAFKESVEPLDRIIKRVIISDLTISEAQLGNKLDDLINNFHNHADQMCQAARLVCLICIDSSKVKIIQTIVSQLEALDPELVPAILLCHKETAKKEAILELKLLRNEWLNSVRCLTATIDKITDPYKFIVSSVNQIIEEIESIINCRDITYKFIIDVKSIIGKTGRVCIVGTSLINSRYESIDFGKYFATFVKNLSKCIPVVRKLIQQIEYAENCRLILDNLFDRLEDLQRNLLFVKDGLDIENHSRILEDMKSTNMTNESTLFNRELSFSTDVENRSMKVMSTTLVEDALLNVKDIAENIQKLAELPSNRDRLDLLTNDMLGYSDILVENLTKLAEFDAVNKKKLIDLATDTTTWSLNVIDSSRKVINNDGDQLTYLQQSCNRWTLAFHESENFLSLLVQSWQLPTNDLILAIKCNNMQQTRITIKEIEKLTERIKEVTKVAKRLLVDNRSETVSQLSTERLFVEQENELENLAYIIATHSDNNLFNYRFGELSDEYLHANNDLKLSIMSWSVGIHCVYLIVLKLTKEFIGQSCVDIKLPEKVDSLSDWKNTFDNCIIECAKIKSWLEPVIMGDGQTADNAKEIMVSLNSEEFNVADRYRSIMNLNQDHFIPIRLCINVLEFAKKMNDASNILDDAVKDFFPSLANLADSFRSSNLSFSNAEMEYCISTDFQKRLIILRKKITEYLPKLETFKRRSVSHCLSRLDTLTIKLLRIVEPEENGELICNFKSIQKLQYEWISIFSRIINDMSGVIDKSELQEIVGLNNDYVVGIKSKKNIVHSVKNDLLTGSASCTINGVLNNMSKLSMTSGLTASIEISKYLNTIDESENFEGASKCEEIQHSTTPITGFPRKHFSKLLKKTGPNRTDQLDKFNRMKMSLKQMKRSTKYTFINIREISQYAKELFDLLKRVAENCYDSKLNKQLLLALECIPTALAQLTIQTNGKEENKIESNNENVIKCCENIVQLTKNAITAAHACCSCLIDDDLMFDLNDTWFIKNGIDFDDSKELIDEFKPKRMSIGDF